MGTGTGEKNARVLVSPVVDTACGPHGSAVEEFLIKTAHKRRSIFCLSFTDAGAPAYRLRGCQQELSEG